MARDRESSERDVEKESRRRLARHPRGLVFASKKAIILRNKVLLPSPLCPSATFSIPAAQRRSLDPKRRDSRIRSTDNSRFIQSGERSRRPCSQSPPRRCHRRRRFFAACSDAVSLRAETRARTRVSLPRAVGGEQGSDGGRRTKPGRDPVPRSLPREVEERERERMDGRGGGGWGSSTEDVVAPRSRCTCLPTLTKPRRFAIGLYARGTREKDLREIAIATEVIQPLPSETRFFLLFSSFSLLLSEEGFFLLLSARVE